MRWHYAIPMILKQRRIILKQEDNRLRVMSYEYRIKNKNGMYQWSSVRARFVQTENYDPAVYDYDRY